MSRRPATTDLSPPPGSYREARPSLRPRLALTAQWVATVAAAPLLLTGYRPALGLGLLLFAQLVRLASPAERRRYFDLPALLPALGLLVAATLGYLVSPFPELGHSKLLGIALGVGVYSAIVATLRGADEGDRPRRLGALTGLVLAAGVPLALGGFLVVAPRQTSFMPLQRLYALRPELPRDLLALSPIPLVSSHGATLAGGVNPNELAGALTLFAPLFFALVVHRPWRGWRLGFRLLAMLGAFAGFVVTAGVTVATVSRGAIAGLLVGFLTALILRGPRTRALILTLAAVGTAALVILSPDRSALPDQLAGTVDRAFAVRASDVEVDLGTRAGLWRHALYLIQSHPFTGVGLNVYTLFVQDRSTLATNLGGITAHAHNLLLQTALDAGLPGLALFLALLALAVVSGFRAVRRKSDPATAGVAAGLVAALAAHLTYSVTDAVALGAKPGVFLWVVLALLVGAAPGRVDRASRSERSIVPNRLLARLMVVAAGLLTLAGAAGILWRPVVTSAFLNAAQLTLDRGELLAADRVADWRTGEAAERLFLQALDYSPDFRPALGGLGFALLAEGRVDEANALWRQSPEVVDELVRRGDATRLANQPGRALAWYDRALALGTPRVSQLQLYRAQALRSLPDPERADQALAAAVAADSGWENDWSRYYTHFLLGVRLYEQKRYPEADGMLLRAVELCPATEQYQASCADAHHYRGLVARAEKRPADAATELAEAAALNPKSAWVFLNLGQVLAELSRPDDAAAAFARATAVKADDPNPWRSVIGYWQSRKDTTRASAACLDATGSGVGPKVSDLCAPAK